MGINARTPLHPAWTTHHVPVVEGFMLATIKVTRKGQGTLSYNQATGQYSGASVTQVWTGQARIQPYGIIGDVNVAQDPTGRRLMRVQVVDKDAGIELDDHIEVTSCPDDPELLNYMLEVRGAIGSSNSWVRDLVCEADLKAR